MPIHDWTRVSAGTYHNFHQMWTVRILDALNGGILPAGYYVMTDQVVGGPEPDVVLLDVKDFPPGSGGTAVATFPPPSRQVSRLSRERAGYARRANRLSVRDHDGRVIALIELVSPGNKDSADHFDAFVGKLVKFVRAGVHVVVVDLFPPTPRDPEGVDRAIWDRLGGQPFEPRPAGKPLTVAAVEAGEEITAYSDPVAVGDALPNAPLFLAPGWYVNVPLEPTYAATWAVTPEPIRAMFDRPPA
ncbi:MAG TPA: DUF4058 family protein [Urbifossiella sp.]|nr:DUF4058 family protein [Urbifossiella sp.]